MPRPLPVPREEILKLLRAGGMTETAIAERLGISRTTVGNIRQQAGLPAPRRGHAPVHASIEDAYRAQAQPADGGHMRWTGTFTGDQAPMVKHRRTLESAYRVAFRIHHGRQPDGIVMPVCGTPQCVAGAHLEDTAMRHARKRAVPQRKPGPAGASRADIIALLREGRSDRYIGRALRTNPKRVGRIRDELGLPKAVLTVLTLEEKWAALTRPVEGGHLEWAGPRRGTTPIVHWRGEVHTARHTAFRMAHRREPVGQVRAGCGWPPCVAPEHVEDQPMRDLLNDQYAAIFGAAA